MPELPEVETVLRGLKARSTNRRVTSVEVSHPGAITGLPEDFVRNIDGRRIAGLERKGKVIGMELRGEDGAEPSFLLIRLGMTGQVTVSAVDAPLEAHTHIRLALDDGREEIRFRDPRRFGRLRCCTRSELDEVFGRLGPDAQQITEEQFLGSMRGRKGAIKSWLMNQQVLAGLGNIYADEALFLARVHPLARPGRVSLNKARQLYRAIRKVLDHAVALQGTSFRDYIDIEGRPGNYTPRLRVYQREGEPCRRCKTRIGRIVIAGRSSHFCPRCQPRPRRTAGMRALAKSRLPRHA
jgi:formamidopyrimidine-DNA glycosylase